MGYLQQLLLIGCGVFLVWTWWQSGQTGILKSRGQTFTREDQPFFFYTMRWFSLLVGLWLITMIPFMPGLRALLGH